MEGKAGIKSSNHLPTHLLRGQYQNISFVYERDSFVLHVASKGDKVRVTRSTLSRNRKCCCEHQLLLRSTRAARGLGLPRHCQIKRLLSCARQPPPTPLAPPPSPLLFKGGKPQRWEGLHGFSRRGGCVCCHLEEHCLHSVVVNVESTFVSCRAEAPAGGRGSDMPEGLASHRFRRFSRR